VREVAVKERDSYGGLTFGWESIDRVVKAIDVELAEKNMVTPLAERAESGAAAAGGLDLDECERMIASEPPDYYTVRNLLAECRALRAAPFAMGWYQRGDGRYAYSLRSRGDFDVSELAKKYGGGGHKNAAGFLVESRVDEEPNR
jgi:hypothetical protein